MYLLSHSLSSINEWGQLSLMKQWEALRSRLRAKEREKEGASLIKITRVETPSISLHPTTVIHPYSNIPRSTNQISTTWTYIMSAQFLDQCAHVWIKPYIVYIKTLILYLSTLVLIWSKWSLKIIHVVSLRPEIHFVYEQNLWDMTLGTIAMDISYV